MASLNAYIPYSRIARIAPVMAQPGESMASVAARVGCDYIINGGTYSLASGKLDSGLKIDDKYEAHREQYGIGIRREDGRLEWSYAGTWCPTWFGMYAAGKGADGEIYGNHLKDRRQRTGIGYDANGVYLAAVTNGMTTADFAAKYFAGCKAWINLDGGASTQWIAPDSRYISSRKVRWYICVWLKQDNNNGGANDMMVRVPLEGDISITAAYDEQNAKLWKDGHKGIDLVGSSDVLSACDGTVRVVAYDAAGWGQYVTVGFGDKLICLYAHLAKGSVLVKPGDKVKLGQNIGIMGSTGNSTGKHLHFQINDLNGHAQDPTEILGIENKRGKVTPRSTTAEHWAAKHYNNLVARGAIDGGNTSSVWTKYDESSSNLTVGQVLALIDKATK